MKKPFPGRRTKLHGFTLKDLLAVVAICLVLGVLFSATRHSRERSKRIACSENLKQIGISFKTWPTAQTDDYPMAVYTNFDAGKMFRYFQIMSNLLGTPKLLTCPTDNRKPAKSFESLSNSNISYFVGLDANEETPQMFLSGDRNITGGVLSAKGVLQITTNDSVGWSHLLHKTTGNILMADGSVQQLSTARLQDQLRSTGAATNRLALP